MITTAGADIKRFEDNFLQDSGFLGQKLYCEYLAAKDVDLNNFYCYENLNLMLSGSNLSCAGIVREHQKESLLAFCSFMDVYFLESRQDNLCAFPKQALSLMEYAGNAEESDGIICDDNIYGFASFCSRNFEDVSFDMVYSSFARKINKNLGHAYCLNKDGQTVSAAFAEEPLLNHTGAVTALAFDGESGRIYSAGEDGFLKIWDTRSLDMTGSFSVSDVALTAAAVSKNADRMVLVERRGPSRFGILLRSLKEQKPLARIFIESPVNRIAFSPSGGMVIVAQNRKDSLLFFDADTLQRIVLPFQVTEPVLDFYINDRETAFLAVTQSGTIFYYNLIDNKVIKTLRGPKNPQSPCILPGGNYLLTQSGTKLSLVSLATGKVINSAELPGKDARQIVPRALGTVSYWSASSRELIVYTWNYRKTGEIFMPSQMIRNPEPVSAVIEGGSGFCIGYQTGSVSVLGSDSRNVPISSVFVPEPISDIALAGGILYAATDRQIHSLSAASKAVAKVPPLNPLGRPV